jgi:hypothetical protein
MARVDGLSSAAVPVEIVALNGAGAAVTSSGTFTHGLWVKVQRASDALWYDFADGTFKDSPTTLRAALTEYSVTKVPGLCHLVGGWTPTADDTYSLIIEQIAGGVTVANVPMTKTLVVGEFVGSSAMGDNLVDEIAVIADELRDDLHSEFGVRQWRCYVTKSVWSGGRVGVGARTVSYVKEMLPSPKVALVDRHDLTEGGLQETGTATLKEISLTYSQADLLGEPMAAGEDFHYLLVDGLGQGISRRTFIPQDHPYPDRENNIGWEVKIRRVDNPPNVAVAYG